MRWRQDMLPARNSRCPIRAIAVYEATYADRHPRDEVVNFRDVPFDVGLIHYASDTPYSRRQSLLSKSLSYFGVEATSACACAIVRRIFAAEIERLREEEEGR